MQSVHQPYSTTSAVDCDSNGGGGGSSSRSVGPYSASMGSPTMVGGSNSVLAPITPAQPRQSLLHIIVSTGSCLLFYFITSITLTMFNKWLFTEASAHANDADDKKPLLMSPYGFHFPLTVTCVHQAQVFMIVLVSEKVPWFTNRVGKVERSQSAFYTLAPVGAVSGLDWGLSNTSLRYIPLSLYEMVKSASPVIVLLLSFRIGLAKATPAIMLIILMISIGTFLSVSGGNVNIFKDASFPLKGFVFVTVATLLSGVRNVLTQYALQKGGIEVLLKAICSGGGGSSRSVGSPSSSYGVAAAAGGGGIPSASDQIDFDGHNNSSFAAIDHQPVVTTNGSPLPSSYQHQQQQQSTTSNASSGLGGVGSHGGFNTMTALYYCAPSSSLAVLLPALVFEGHAVFEWFVNASQAHRVEVCLWVCLSSAIAFLLTIAEFTMTGMTSALTMCVTGIAKQVLIVGLAMAMFGEHLGLVNAIGFSMSIVGIFLYKYIKYADHQREKGYATIPTSSSAAAAAGAEMVVSYNSTNGTDNHSSSCYGVGGDGEAQQHGTISISTTHRMTIIESSSSNNNINNGGGMMMGGIVSNRGASAMMMSVGRPSSLNELGGGGGGSANASPATSSNVAGPVARSPRNSNNNTMVLGTPTTLLNSGSLNSVTTLPPVGGGGGPKRD